MTFLDGRIPRLLLALAVVGLGFVIYLVFAEGPTGTDGDVVNVEVDYAFEPADERQLVGFATNVFVWYTIAAQPFGSVPIEDETRRADLVKRFEQAREQQIPYDPTGAK